MPFNKKLFISPILLTIALLLISWGNTGHTNIASHMALSFNDAMQPFTDWVSYITEHSSDADYRKNDDPDEGVRHYIDIDNYAEFNNTGAIPQSLDEMISIYGSYTIYDNGVLPWATLNTYDSLVACMQRYDWEKAKYYAADLSHYVGDGHMPLHITNNYNGYLTDNDGIHSRYESTMLNAHIQEIVFTGQSIQEIDSISDYIFSYLYASYPYVDSILAADDYAKTFSTNTSSTAYKDALWDISKDYTAMLLNKASHALTELLYNAWLDAGSPDITGNGIEQQTLNNPNLQIFPNPGKGQTTLEYQIKHETFITIQAFDLNGKMIRQLVNENKKPGTYLLNWNTEGALEGVFLVKLITPDYTCTQKIILSQ
jgi:hypothetical protein